jgi:hypothetical protein
MKISCPASASGWPMTVKGDSDKVRAKALGISLAPKFYLQKLYLPATFRLFVQHEKAKKDRK